MNWIASASLILQISLLLYVAVTDIATRLIDNETCVIIAALGIVGQISAPSHIVESLIAAAVLFLLLLVIYTRGWMGGGDVKLLTALAIGLPLAGVMKLLTVTALAGAVLALLHLVMRSLPHPKPAPAGSSAIRRVYAIERWRNVRRAPLPYGVAISCGGVWALLSQGH